MALEWETRMQQRRSSAELTDTTSLPLPCGIEPLTDRTMSVGHQAVTVPATWWNHHLAKLNLPGSPLQVNADGQLTRELVWRHAAGAADDDEAALRLLWHALAWGAGFRLRQCRRRLTAIAGDQRAATQALRHAAGLAATEPQAAYKTLHPRGGTVIRALGPAFGTKFLYFAGGGRPDHSSLILDSRVAAALHRSGWTSLRSGGGWPPMTYGRYCALLRRWAKELSAEGEGDVAADQIEYWLFRSGSTTQKLSMAERS